MKKILATVLAGALMLLGTSAFAQFSIGGGFTHMSLGGADSDAWDEVSLPGFYVGVGFNHDFSELDGLQIEPGIYFAHYGKTFSPNAFGKDTYHANYIVLPLNIKYQVEMDNGFEAFGFTGPRFNLGFGDGSGVFKKLSNEGFGLRNADAQWGVGGGLVFSHSIALSAGYDFGLNKMIKADSSDAIDYQDYRVRRNGFHFGISFIF